ncbi:potassium transporter TrkG [Salmonella enterica]|nr:potassium transporter TrkG [Salmonella enterica]EGM2344844.1 potassium transporter TrkG [Salmonella enterica]EGM2363680.1 potassium transporter TrkG [Salmonella enterica]
MYIFIRFRVVFHLCSFLVALYSLTMFPPMLLALFEKEKSFFAFLSTFIMFFTIGVIGWLVTRQSKIQLQTRDGFIIIVLFWTLFSIISAMPLWLDDTINISLTDAMFEGVSGITTTGGSVFNDVSLLPRSILYYRSQLNFIGGLGVIVLAVAVLPLLGIGGAKLYQSEMPGPFKEERLTPRLADTAKSLWFTYMMLGGSCIIAYMISGMDFFDSLCHGLSTVSLGGFSTRSESLGYYNSLTIEAVAGIFSLLSAFNFTLYFIALSKRTLRPFKNNSELHFFLFIVAVVVIIITFEVWRANMYSLPASFIHSFFMVSSIITDNGLATDDFASWPSHIVVLLLSVSFFGGCIGSTCGGIKALRFLILFLQSRQEVHQLTHPRAIMSIRVGKSIINERVLKSVWSFFFLYILCTCFFIWALTLLGYDLMTSFASVAACINNMGLGAGQTAAGFGALSDSAKYILCGAMLLGRLEIYPLLILLSRTFWRS